MSTSPEVSIILPTRNRAQVLGRAIESVLGQTFSSFELIIVDDASTDDTPEVAKGFRDERIKYVRQPERAGAAAAENRGIALALGRFIAFIDDDDEWLPRKLSEQVDRFRGEPATTGVVYCARLLVGGDNGFGPPREILRKHGEIYEEILTKRTFVPLVCAMVRKECFARSGVFDTNLVTSNDYDLWIRISRDYRMVYLPEPLVKVHVTPGSLSRDPDLIITARRQLLKKHAEEYARIGRETSAFFLWQIGGLLLLKGESWSGRGHLVRAWTKLPWKLGHILSLVVSFAGSAAYQRAWRHLRRLVAPGPR